MQKQSSNHFHRLLAVCALALGALFGAQMSASVIIEPFAYDLNEDGTAAIAVFRDFAMENFDGNLEIPSTIEYEGKTYKVTTINRAVLASKNLVSLTLGKYVRTLGSLSVAYNPQLTTLTLNEELETIESEAFSGDTGITSITLPQSLKTLCAKAFYNTGLSGTFTVPASVDSLANGVVQGMKKITAIAVEPGNKKYTSVDGVVYTKDLKTLWAYPCGKEGTSFAVPAGTVTIASSSMRDLTLTSVSLPASVTTLGSFCFSGTTLGSFTVPAGVTTIGRGPFYLCNSLKEINVESGNKNFEMKSGCLVDKTVNNILAAIPQTGEFTVPDGIESIGDYSLAFQTQITKLTIPSSVKSIGYASIYGCSKLTEASIAEGLQSIGGLAFQSCSVLKTINFPNSLRVLGNQALGRTPVSEVVLNNGLEEMMDAVFYFCSNLKSITIPGTVKKFGTSMFWGCTSLQSAVLEEGLDSVPNAMFNEVASLTSVTLPSTIKSIGDAAFASTGLTTVDLPANLEYIGEMAFQMSPLVSFNVPDKVTEIGGYALSWNGDLKEVTLGKSVKKIGEYCMESCSALTKLTLNEGLETIKPFAISWCSSLTELTIPSTVTQIDSCAMYGTPLTSLTNKAVAPQTISYDVFQINHSKAIYNTCTLYVPQESLETYKSAENWKEFYRIEALMSGVDDIDADEVTVVAIYKLDGTKVDEPTNGVNILKMSNGTTRKVIIRE